MKFFSIKPGSTPIIVGKDCFTLPADQLARIRERLRAFHMLLIRLPLIARESPGKEPLELLSNHVSFSFMHDYPETDVPLIVLTEEDLSGDQAGKLSQLDRTIAKALCQMISTANQASRPIVMRDKRVDAKQTCPLCYPENKYAVLRVPKNYASLLAEKRGGYVSCKECGIRVLLSAEELASFKLRTLQTKEFVRAGYGSDGKLENCPKCLATGISRGLILLRIAKGQVVARMCRNWMTVQQECEFNQVRQGDTWVTTF
ncbi:hypothetical protein [Nitrospira lenta]|uniref:Uncharacterized protein n=1 Tax=Nitrospira lenta TaxID=1436998 RepID=A0A330L451_9BACT|nr:hypothetical protein [Nitrospira lenta]SPP63969.1 hypothetical protein NITLEN_11055 [Nitrospira lenta]